MPTVFAILVMIVIVGWLWFYVARPILEDYNLIGPREIPTYTVKTSQDAPRIMSRETAAIPPVPPTRTTRVRAGTYHVVRPKRGVSAAPIDVSHTMSRDTIIALLAVQKNEHGDYRYSKNSIAALVGGTRGDVLARIDSLRVLPSAPATPAPADKKRGKSLRRPLQGW